jgi:hypothetical protein
VDAETFSRLCKELIHDVCGPTGRLCFGLSLSLLLNSILIAAGRVLLS